MVPQPNGNHAATATAGVYVDTENLREQDLAQDVISRTVSGWPDDYPPIASLSLYVRADKVALWRMWAEATYPTLAVRVRGVQHFSREMAKNSADLAITADAIGDLAAGDVSCVAVISNDSDFGALFVKVREMAAGSGGNTPPFLWVTTPGGGAISSEIDRFIPDQFRWDLPVPDPANPAPGPSVTRRGGTSSAAPPRASDPDAPKSSSDVGRVSADAVADELIRSLPVGKFRAADARRVVMQRWPDNLAARNPAQFGQFLIRELWPELELRGVTMPRSTSPRVYEISAPPVAESDPPRSVEPEPTREKSVVIPPGNELDPYVMAGAIADNIADDVFKATDAQLAIAECWPAHPTASYTAQRFGMWFAEHLWPVMEEHGVMIAAEKPRRYEMTPDARHRLIDQAGS